MMHVEQVTPGRWVCRCNFSEKDIPKMAGFRWDPTNHCWWTPKAHIAAKLMDPDGAAQAMTEHEQKLHARAEAVDASRATTSAVELPCPDGLAYMPFQRAGIAGALSRRAVLFGDEMGLGKTIQAIGMINTDATLRKVLVICPASLKLNWQREMKKWMTRPATVCIASSTFCRPDAFDITVVNYDICWKHREILRSVKWDFLICDEAHLMKNPKAKRTRAVCGIDDYTSRKEECEPLAPIEARRAAFLTGTPIPNRPIEAWPLAHYLAPDEFRSFYTFATRYCAAGNNGYGWDASGSSHLAELQERLRATIMIRRLKSEVLTELPAKRRAVIEFSANGAAGVVAAEMDAWGRHEEKLNSLRVAVELAKASDRQDDYADAVASLSEAARAAFTEMSKLRHETAVAKIPYVIEHLRTITDAGSKVVVFAHHHDVIEALAAEFKTEAVVVYGPTPQAQRQANVDRFQTDPDCLVAIGGFGPMGVGWTLTAASHVVFAELDWTPGNITQAEDRCHRIGQQDMVLVQHLVLEGSLDARMASILVEKQEVQAAALDTITRSVPAIPAKEKAATENATRAAIEAEAKTLTAEQIVAIGTGLQLLANMDADHARQLNGMGFSKIDCAIGHILAQSVARGLSGRQAALGLRLVTKYHRQLPDALVAATARTVA